MSNQPPLFPDWVKDAIFYQIFPDRFFNGDPSNNPEGVEPWGNPPTRTNFFGGDLQGIMDKLNYLQDLGVNALYLNPIFKARTNHKYDTCDYLQVDTAFGSNDLLKDLVSELHSRDMRIILDGVFNHCGDGFWAFEDVKTREAASAYSDWFIVQSYPIRTNPLSYYACGGCWYLPKFNTSNPQVRQYLMNVATHWIQEADIDGWRLDTPCKVPIDFWQEFRPKVKAVKPQAYLVGEIWRDAAPWTRQDVFDGATNYPLRELILSYCATDLLDAEDFAYEVKQLYKCLGVSAQYMLNLLGCHDTKRVLTLFNGEVDRLLIAYTFLMTTVGAPLIYYGDEVGMRGEMDPDCRRTMVWDETQWDLRIFNHIRSLLVLRLEHESFRTGTFEALVAFDRACVYRQSYKDDESIVILNPGPTVNWLKIPTKSDTIQWYDTFTKTRFAAVNGEILIETVPPISAAILFPE